MQAFIQSILVDHWPFFAVVAILMITGQVASKRVFIKSRAYVRPKGKAGYFIQSFWYWGRELLPILLIVVGAGIGALWRDPEGKEWNVQTSMGYFGFAGAISNLAWMWLKGRAKAKGLDLKLPGRDTVPPK